MADVLQTPNDVREAAGIVPQSAIAAEAIAAGQWIRINANSKEGELADCTEQQGQCDGLAVSGAIAGQRFNYQSGGTLDVGAVLDEGQLYVLSEGGAMAPVADLAAGDFVTLLGIGEAGGTLVQQRWQTKKQVQ